MAGGASAGRGGVRLVAAAAVAALAGACTTTGDFAPPTTPVQPAIAITVADLPGNWGLASYRAETDKARTETEARSACNNPYQIGSGPTGGVVMHLADQPTPTEVFLKVAPDGRTFLGPRGPAGTRTDRLLVSFDNGVLVTEWMDPSARERYGTMVFVKCVPKKK